MRGKDVHRDAVDKNIMLLLNKIRIAIEQLVSTLLGRVAASGEPYIIRLPDLKQQFVDISIFCTPEFGRLTTNLAELIPI